MNFISVISPLRGSCQLPVIFDAADVDYMSANLTEQQLQKSLRNHDIHRSIDIAQRWPNYLDADNLWWLDFALAAQLALDHILSLKPKPKYKHSKTRIDPQEVKERTDIVQLVEGHTKLRRSGQRYVGHCPFHQEKSPSFTVYPNNQSWYCFSCGKGGDSIDFIMAIENVDFKAAVEALA